MQRSRSAVLAGILAGAAVLVTGCSSPDAPSPSTTPAATAQPTSASTPSAGPTSASGPATTVPSSSPGQPEGTVPSRAVETAPAKKLDEPASTAGATFSLVSVKTSDLKGTGPGDASGPGVVLRLKVVNTTSRTLDTSSVQVNLSNAAGNPGTLLTGPPADPIGSSVRAGRSAEGTYAFLLAGATTDPVTVSVYLTSGKPVLQFSGRAS